MDSSGKKANQCSPSLGSMAFKGNSVEVRKASVEGSTNTAGERKKSTKND